MLRALGAGNLLSNLLRRSQLVAPLALALVALVAVVLVLLNLLACGNTCIHDGSVAGLPGPEKVNPPARETWSPFKNGRACYAVVVGGAAYQTYGCCGVAASAATATAQLAAG